MSLPPIDPFVGPRSKDAIRRSLNAMRRAARSEHPFEFAHLKLYRAAFVRSILEHREMLMDGNKR